MMLCADHGPCVSGAHNAIVTSRAGKDLVSCLVSGLLTIGPRFGGAIDDAARWVGGWAGVGGGGRDKEQLGPCVRVNISMYLCVCWLGFQS